MAPLAPDEFARAAAASPLAARLAKAVDPESAREMLAARIAGRAAESPATPTSTEAPRSSSPAPRPHADKTPAPRGGGGTTGADVAKVAAAAIGGLFRFASSRTGQTILRGVLGVPARTRRR
jgi:hypothetical protein